MSDSVLDRPAPARSTKPKPAPSSIAPADFVTIKVFEACTGYSEKAVRIKIDRGVWLENREYVRAPDGHILISMKGYYRWAAPDLA